MQKKSFKFSIGMRTIKTAVAVSLSMFLVEIYGATTSKLIFAMLGAMAAVQPTFNASMESCITQIVGVLFGATAGVVLIATPIPPVVAAGIGIVLVITLYNAFQIKYSPSLPCFMVVMICTTPDIQPFSHALGRIWDTAIGLGVGMLINTLVFPYDNSRRIQSTAASLDKELIRYLEGMFDGDEDIPDVVCMSAKLDDITRQLQIFSNQKLVLRMYRQKQEIEVFKTCEGKARELVAQMEILCRMGRPGALSEENRLLLEECGAEIRDKRLYQECNEQDIVTNYHLRQIIRLRKELLDVLSMAKALQKQ